MPTEYTVPAPNTVWTYRTINGDVMDARAVQDTDGWTVSSDITYARFLTQSDLDRFAHKIYKIIVENTKIDISEDEFMRLLAD